MDSSQPDVEFAIEAVREASRLVKQIQAELVEPAMTKEDRSPVTVADFASQALVGCLVEQAYPEVPLVAEEDATVLRDPESAPICGQVARFVGRHLAYATPETVCEWIDRGAGRPEGRFWTLDPIDGTKGFLRGDQYAVALALVQDGQTLLGVLGCPNLSEARRPDKGGSGSLLVAVRGQGAWVAPLDDDGRFTRLRVSDHDDPADARVLSSFEAGHTNVGRTDEWMGALGVQAEAVRMDSQAKYGLLAAGAGELLVRFLSPKQPDYKEKIWDHAAGSLVVEEAGGRVTDLRGKPLDFTTGRTLANNRGILASNSLLHDAALEALRTLS